jgi:hypothetical protein
MTAPVYNYYLKCPDCGELRWQSGRCPKCRVHLVGWWKRRSAWRDPSDRAWLFHRAGTAQLHPGEDPGAQRPR